MPSRYELDDIAAEIIVQREGQKDRRAMMLFLTLMVFSMAYGFFLRGLYNRVITVRKMVTSTPLNLAHIRYCVSRASKLANIVSPKIYTDTGPLRLFDDCIKKP